VQLQISNNPQNRIVASILFRAFVVLAEAMATASRFASAFAGTIDFSFAGQCLRGSQLPGIVKPKQKKAETGALNTRAETQSEESPVSLNKSKAASITALEQLKASSANRYTKERSSILVIGLSVHTAPVEMREKLAIPEAEWPRAIGELCSLNHIEEAAVLSTCNRMEIYVVALSWHRGIREVTEWMAKTSNTSWRAPGAPVHVA